jgi:very-short-patch-repair endonuclease
MVKRLANVPAPLERIPRMSEKLSSVSLALTRWRNNLIDLTRRNPLLALRQTLSSSLTLSHPPAPAIWQRLVRDGKSCNFWLPPADEDEEEGHTTAKAHGHVDRQNIQTKPGEIVCGDLGRKQLLRVLTNLYRRSGTEYRERGLHILHIAFGVLQWRGEDDAEPFRSPLVLTPVELERASLIEPFKLLPLEEEPFVNPALSARLQQDFDFQLPPPPEAWDETDVADYLKAVEAAIAGLPGWSVETGAVLSLFSFFKGVMYRDLEEHAERAAAHPLVRALAGEAVGDALTPGALPTEDELDAVEPADGTFTILDADASQRLCLAAAARGNSFVLHGPPGTGKSQTIANLIAECLAKGKKVLFVSDKMAALEVVYNRLRAAGLGDFCLELHSHKASKRAVVQELKRCLEERRQPDLAANGDVFGKLQERREQLTQYVRALHQAREPLGRSVWWALGELIRCAGLPAAPWAPPESVEMTPAWLESVRQGGQRADQLWHICEQGPDYPWCGFKASERYSLKLRDEILAILEKARKQLDKLSLAAEQYAGQIGAKGSVAWLLRTGELLETSPKPPLAWLTATDLPALAANLEKCAELYQHRGHSRDPLTERYGPALWSLPEGTAATVDRVWHETAPLLAAGDDRGAGLLTHQQQLRGWAAETQKRVPGWLVEARTIEKWLSLTLPRGAGDIAASAEDPSPFSLRRLVRLANLCASENAPEKSWVVDPEANNQAKELIEANQAVLTRYHAARNKLLLTYDETLFDLELDRIAAGFAGPYRSIFRFFNMQYRRDRRSIVRRTAEDKLPATVAEDVLIASELAKEKTRVEAEQAVWQKALGRYENGVDSDLDAAGRARRIGDEAVDVVHELGHERLPDKFVEALSAASPPPEKIRGAIKRLQESVGAWHHLTEELQEFLPAEAMPGMGHPLEECAVSAVVQYAKDLQASLNRFASLADPVLTKAKSAPPDAAAMVEDLREAELLREQEKLQESDDLKWASRFGPAFKGMTTDWKALKKALTWTIRTREHFAAASPDWQPKAPDSKLAAIPEGSAGILPAAFLQLATGPGQPAVSTKELRAAQEQFGQALHSLELRFEPPAPLAGGVKLSNLPLDECKKRLTALRDRAGELSDWMDWRELGKRFEHLGLADCWAALQQAKPPREQVVDALLKSVLSWWVDRVFRETPALSGFRREEHERLLHEFRQMDRDLAPLNAHRVGLLADARRPQAPRAIPGSAVALLMREAHKKARHLPVRRLFEEIPDLLLQLKPCMLMSPLSVSQFLDPGKVQFDLVVFDEASQICPEDAVGAILRGKQVVVTGDDKQLPPTNFFQQLADDDGDEEDEDTPASFESVLDACLGAGMRPHFLRWHYRSRHEGLIAFSNQQYYDNRLITFPGPLAGKAAAGVEFRHVSDGIYDRGGRRDNVREAEVVADLVFEHFSKHADKKTLGVIAFSQAQMFAIEDEIDRRLVDHPELAVFFKGDRLGGFFVKNLETVQGDERDVILLSVGYGRDANGKFAQHFGPINRNGGQRRLNVAITRAREKLIVVASIRASDIEVGATAAEGVRHLRSYLAFAEGGLEVLVAETPASAPTTLSPLETDVMTEVQQLGYQVVPQVGCGGIRVDLGIIDPRQPDTFLLGIECDGPSYHSTPTARDRDRLRYEVLDHLGWRLHRIWSVEWFQRRHQEIERLRELLENCKNSPGHEVPSSSQPAEAVPIRKVEVGEPNAPGNLLPGTTVYRAARLKVDKSVSKAEIHAAAAQSELQRLTAQVANEEGPIHLDLATQRLRQAWKLMRAGERVREAIDRAAAEGESAGRLRRQGDFLWPLGAAIALVRVPNPKDDSTFREIDQICDQELEAGIRLLLEHGGAMDGEAILSQTARLFGFKKLGDGIKQRIADVLTALQGRGTCIERNGTVALKT